MMTQEKQFDIISSFPDFNRPGFSLKEHNERFHRRNVIISATASQVYYPEHWGPFSIKCAFQGTEHYTVGKCRYAVTDHRYLLLNHGNYYSSYIDSDSPVESFTINFRPGMLEETVQGLTNPHEFMLAGSGDQSPSFIVHEQLYPQDEQVTPVILRLKKLVEEGYTDGWQMEELYALLLEKILLNQQSLQGKIAAVPAKKKSTKQELYTRLTRAKDFIDSCYAQEITLETLAAVTLLNQTYFLRQFRSYYKITPGQYLIRRRMEAAREILLKKKNISITDLSIQVGYNDLASFSKLFKQYYQASPENYRRNITGSSLK
jgi:AraC family transcriptional regulator